MPALDALGGIRKMRCRAPLSRTIGWGTYEALAREGVQFCFTLPIRSPSALVSDLAAFSERHPKSIWAIEFPNEPDLNPVSYKGLSDARLGARRAEAPAFIQFCEDVTSLLTKSNMLRHIPRIASNDWMHKQQARLVTYANAHFYPKAVSIEVDWITRWNKLLNEANTKKGVITEWGRTTGGNANNNVAPPVSLSQQAALLRADLEQILSVPSVEVVSLYELFSWKSSSEQDNFGLFNADLTPRPVVQAIRDLLS